MKKFITFMLATLLMGSANAQQTKYDIDKDGSVTVSDITTLINVYLEQGMDTGTDPGDDTTLLHEFTGYIFVTSAYFTDSYYGNEAVLAVYKTAEGEYIVTFSDPQWGEATFTHVTVGQQLDGSGTLTMLYHGQMYEYAATLSGPMTTPVISIPDVMDGTSITFHVGNAPVCYTTAGNYAGTNTVVVGGMFSYSVDMTYKITANADGTINIVVPEVQLNGTMMGDIVMGGYTVSNVAWDDERGAFYRDYSKDGLSVHLTISQNGTVTMDDDFAFSEDNAVNILAKPTEDGGIKIVNNFQPGKMPFPIAATFEGTKTPNLK